GIELHRGLAVRRGAPRAVALLHVLAAGRLLGLAGSLAVRAALGTVLLHVRAGAGLRAALHLGAAGRLGRAGALALHLCAAIAYLRLGAALLLDVHATAAALGTAL